MKTKTLFLIFPILILQSCSTIMMKMYGVKNPEVGNEQSIQKRALKYGLGTTNIVTVHSPDLAAKLTGCVIPNASIYDRNGKYIEYSQTDTSCNAGLFQFIPEPDPANNYYVPDGMDLNGELTKFRDMKGTVPGVVEQADFYVLVYRAVWTGKSNKDHVQIWEDLSKNNKQAKIRVIKLNLDMQEYRGEWQTVKKWLSALIIKGSRAGQRKISLKDACFQLGSFALRQLLSQCYQKDLKQELL